MDTSLKPSSAVVSLASRLHPLLTQLKQAVDAKAKDPSAVHAVLDTLATTIESDAEMKARPGLRELVTPSTDPKALPALSTFMTTATSADMRSRYYKDVIDRLTQEINAPEGGRRRRRRITRKGHRKAKRTTRRR